jgi:16S rRNA (adenine1518-N6/adenine1519-N6)-dimethyltransferase
VAQRICEKKGTKATNLSVLVQAFMMRILFVDEKMFYSATKKVKSGVLRLRRKKDYSLPCGEKLFSRWLKRLFNNKTMRNSLKTMNLI